MSEIIGFPVRMRFTALREFDIRSGVGGVIGVFWRPEQHLCTYGRCGDQQDDHPAISELKAAASQSMVAVPRDPAEPCNGGG